MTLARLKHNKIVDSLRLGFDCLSMQRSGKCPIVVHAMPKTGGTTIHHSIQACVRQRVFHTHSLEAESLDKKARLYREVRGGAPYHVAQGRMLGKYIAAKKGKNIKVISLVREPVARFISLFFQTGKAFHGKYLDSEGNYDVDAVSDHLSTGIRNMPTRKESREMEWFRREFLGVLGIDVFNVGFRVNDGFGFYRNDRIDALIIRLEDLDRCLESALRPFVAPDQELSLQSKNRGSEKDYAGAYQTVRAAIRLPRAVLKEIYNDQFVKHFYTAEMIEGFIKRWQAD